MDPVIEAPPRLPENCAVRLIDLGPGAEGALAVDETGFVNIYINARLSHDGQLKALRHELRHFYRGDLYSEAGIRQVERLADGPLIQTVGGATLGTVPPGFAPEDWADAGEGRCRPTGRNLARIAADLAAVRALLLDAGHICAVMQPAPTLPAAALAALAGGLGAGDIGFMAFQPEGFSALRFCREEDGRLHGALFYDRRGRLDNALAAFEYQNRRLTVDLRKRRGWLDVSSIAMEAEGRLEIIY